MARTPRALAHKTEEAAVLRLGSSARVKRCPALPASTVVVTSSPSPPLPLLVPYSAVVRSSRTAGGSRGRDPYGSTVCTVHTTELQYGALDQLLFSISSHD
eukprot:COSAG02_NODE_919_length_15936_cov_5.055314_2_plen_101_part_00